MPSQPASIAPFEGRSVCLFCGSSPGSDPAFMEAAAVFGQEVARAGWRLVYGGGGVGLMGASARAAYAEGGRVLGVMPEFLRSRERLFDDVETVVVTSMHERKILMYDNSDVFVVAPGGIGTLEEAIEVLSWKRLDLHSKPVIFMNINGFWDSLLAAIGHGVDQGLTPQTFMGQLTSRNSVDATLAAMRELAAR